MKGLALAVVFLLTACGGSAPRAQSSPSLSALASATPTTSGTPPLPTPSRPPVVAGPLTWAAPVRVVAHEPPYDTHVLQSLTCPTTTLCVALDSTGGNVVVSNYPTGGPDAWTVTHLIDAGAANQLDTVGCSPDGLC